MSALSNLAKRNVMTAFGMEKAATAPGSLAGLLGGIGAGAGAVGGFWNADPEADLSRRLRNAAIGGTAGLAAGAGLGYGGGKALAKHAPELVRAYERGPFPAANRTGPEAVRALVGDAGKLLHNPSMSGLTGLIASHTARNAGQHAAQKAYEIWQKPAVRAASGVALGAEGASQALDFAHKWRHNQLAAEEMRKEHPELSAPAEYGLLRSHGQVGEHRRTG